MLMIVIVPTKPVWFGIYSLYKKGAFNTDPQLIWASWNVKDSARQCSAMFGISRPPSAESLKDLTSTAEVLKEL